VLVYEEVAELGLERIGVGAAREVAAEALAGLADRVGDSIDELADRALAALRVPIDAGLAEVLRDGDVGGQLRPLLRDLGAAELEHHAAVGIRDDAVALLVLHRLERVHARLGVVILKFQTFSGVALIHGLQFIGRYSTHARPNICCSRIYAHLAPPAVHSAQFLTHVRRHAASQPARAR
jgi:hypothetical protein